MSIEQITILVLTVVGVSVVCVKAILDNRQLKSAEEEYHATLKWSEGESLKALREGAFSTFTQRCFEFSFVLTSRSTRLRLRPLSMICNVYHGQS